MCYRLFIKDDLDAITSEELEEAIDALPEWRREKALRFKHEQGRKECAYSYLLLCQALREVYGITEQPQFSIGEHGKPSLVFDASPHGNSQLSIANCQFNDPPVSGIHFNLSHCKSAIACVVAPFAVGVDIERIGRYDEALARHVLNDQEFSTVQQASDPQLAFTRYWTQKEAIVKLTGRGIDDDLKNILLKYKDVALRTEEYPDEGYVLTVASYTSKTV